MDSLTLQVLLIDDDEDDYVVTRDLLRKAEQVRFQLTWVDSYGAGLEAIQANLHDVYLVDYVLGAETGLDLLQEAIALGCRKPMILLTGVGNYDIDRQSMALGAADYLVKGNHLNSVLLERSILHAIERNRTKEKISLLTYALESIPDGVYVTTDAGELLFINHALKQLCNYPNSPQFSDQPVDIEHCELLNHILSLVRQKIPHSPLLQTEFTLADPDSSATDRRIMLVEESLVQTPDRTLHFGLIHDITKRKQAESALQKAQQIYQEVEHIAHIGSWELNLETNNLYWSAEVFTIFELDPQHFQPSYQAFLAAIHPDDRDWVNQTYTKHLNDRHPYDLVHRLLMPDGRIKYVREQGSTSFAEDGTPLISRGMVQDVTELQKAQLALQQFNLELEQRVQERTAALTQSQQKFQRLVDDIGDKFLIFSHSPDFILSYVSRGFEPIFGLSAAAVLGQSWLTAIHWLPESLALAQINNQKMLQNKVNSQEFELTFIHPDGQWRTLHITRHAVWDPGGNLSAIEGVVEDITERKNHEAKLQRTNEELMRATRLKDEFLANMSHELRTPLNAVLGMTEALLEETFGPITSQQKNALGTIERSGSHLLKLINDILDLSKIESGQIELDLQPKTIAPLCKSSIVFIQQLAQKKQIKVRTHIPENLPDLLLDERRICQVLINLLNNAVKFTPEGGEISLDIHYPSPIQNKSSPSFLRIAITDTGIGIAPENIPKLFKPFIQIDSALNRKYDGTGLGLALVKDIIHLHGGEVGVTSEVGAGSCFTVDLPCSSTLHCPDADPSGQSENTAPDYPPTRPTRILLAEDNQANIDTVSSYLGAKGYELAVAKNGLEALKITQAENPDLILMDIQMPEMDGLEATRQIRQLPEGATIPIIALTALAMEGDREKCLAVGATDYLSKPIQLKQLVSKIQMLLKGGNP